MPRETKAQRETRQKQEYEDRKIYTQLGRIEFKNPNADVYMEIIRKKIAGTGLGITVVGPHMTLRMASPLNPQELVCVSFQVTEITDTAEFELMDNK